MEHTEQMNEQESLHHNLGAEMRNGGSWFFWIAALSVVNSLVITFAGAGWSFFLGLGITQLIDGRLQIGEAAAFSLLGFVALAVNVIIAALFACLGLFARRGAAWAFILGIFLYVLDGLLCLTYGKYLAVAFHAFALFFIAKGLIASRRLNQGED